MKDILIPKDLVIEEVRVLYELKQLLIIARGTNLYERVLGDLEKLITSVETDKKRAKLWQ